MLCIAAAELRAVSPGRIERVAAQPLDLLSLLGLGRVNRVQPELRRRGQITVPVTFVIPRGQGLEWGPLQAFQDAGCLKRLCGLVQQDLQGGALPPKGADAGISRLSITPI